MFKQHSKSPAHWLLKSDKMDDVCLVDMDEVFTAVRKHQCVVTLCLLLQTLPLVCLEAEDRVDYKFENYQEENGRIGIRTHGLFFETDLTSKVAVRGNLIYDSISGATPTGAPPAPGTGQVRMVQIDDARKAGYLESTFKFDRHSFTPQLAYSTEVDYESIGVSGNYALELNQKNTTLNFGVGHHFDRVIATPFTWIRETQGKDATQFLLGVNQLLGPKMVLTGNLMLAYDQGYLADPYKGSAFEDFPYFPPFPYTLFPEKRPEKRFKQVVSVSLLRRLEKLDASIKGSYRFHHDDWGVKAHTFTVEWNQRIGSRVILSPLVRFHHQTEAHFYGVIFPGDPSLSDEGVPPHYSSDYRLSNLHSLTYGAQLSVMLKEEFYLDLGYRRYSMRGLDDVTIDSVYPESNIFTAGLRLWF